MNKAITDGLVLMPPPFSAGLALWSREDGRPGQGSWAGQANAALVPADQDFGPCLEIQKTQTTTKIRSFQQIPFQPGMYLRVSTRVKCLSGAFPSVRIAGWAGNASNGNVVSAQQTGPSVELSAYGQVVTLTAIIGSGNRPGVDMVWGTAPVYGQMGLDLTGANGGVVRIESITIEDVTDVFLRTMMDMVDVRDYGAIGDGVTDDSVAFEAADTAAAGRTLVVSKGTYFLGQNLTIDSPVRFEGQIAMPASARLACLRNFDLETYSKAFGSELEGFRRALQALFYFTDHMALNLMGRRIDLAAPIDVAAVAGLSSFTTRRVIMNGQLNAVPGPAWAPFSVTSVGTYSTNNPTRLTNVVNAANIPVGARVSGTGVGREVYVRSVNVGAGQVELSRPLWGAAGTRSYTFTRNRYMLDFSGFDQVNRFEFDQIEFQCNGEASGLMLARAGENMRLVECNFIRPRDRGITSIGTGCQSIMVDQCQFLSNEQALLAQDRTTIALNVNANDAKIRNCRVVRFATFAVMSGSTHQIIGNHFFQGDEASAGTRRAGLVFTRTDTASILTGNYIDNCFIEWTNEHDPDPDFENELSFAGLAITGNVFVASNVGAWFRWIVVSPRGSGHFLNGLSVTGNAFRTFNATIDRVEAVDDSVAGLDTSRFRNVVVENNTFHGVSQATVSPLTLRHTQNTAAETWIVNGAGFLPFGGRVRAVVSVVPEFAIQTAANQQVHIMPYAVPDQGPLGQLAHLRWGQAVRGRAMVTLRCDNPT